MKKFLLLIIAATSAVQLSAQSLNILNYSGKMYISRIEVLSTPRYQSYEDHAILSSEMTIPVVEVTKVSFDFEKGIVDSKENQRTIISKTLKKYSTDMGWNVVIYLTYKEEKDRYELVWQEFGEPYYQEITPSEDGVKICRMFLSTKPTATSPENAIMQLLGGYNGF